MEAKNKQLTYHGSKVQFQHKILYPSMLSAKELSGHYNHSRRWVPGLIESSVKELTQEEV